MLLLATSPSGRGGATVLAATEATFSFPSFYNNFDSDNEITDQELAAAQKNAVAAFDGLTIPQPQSFKIRRVIHFAQTNPGTG